MNETLARGLAADAAPGSGESLSIPTFKVGLKPAYRGMSLNQLYDQLEAESVSRTDKA
ncbi:MAG: hypothetical protein ACFE0O_05675 [Opitutales bacterium]